MTLVAVNNCRMSFYLAFFFRLLLAFCYIVVVEKLEMLFKFLSNFVFSSLCSTMKF